MLLLFAVASYGQSAQKVLDKTAKVVSNKSGVQASFTISSKQYGSTSGTIEIKGRGLTARHSGPMSSKTTR